MANVAFKSGLSSALSSATKTEGTFYLTTDTHKLYVYRDSQLIDLNHFIKFVSSQSALLSLNAEVGDIAYITNENILCYRKTKSDPAVTSDWVQINPDTQLMPMNGTAVAVSDITSGVFVKTEIKDDSPNGGNVASGGFSLVGGDNVTITQSGGVITIESQNDTSDHQYAIGTSGSSEDAKITFTTTFAGSTSTAVPITISAGSGRAAISSNSTGVITIDVPEQAINNSVTFDASGVMRVGSTLVEGTTGTTATVTPTLSYGHADNASGIPTSTGAPTSTATFVSGTAVLDVYTAGQVDSIIQSKMQAANAMQYKGTLTSAQLQALLNTTGGATGTHTGDVGDTWKYNDDEPITIGNTTYYKGDMIIAEGTDGSVTYSYVPSGDTYYLSGTATASRFYLEDENSGNKFLDINLATSSSADSRAAITISGTASSSSNVGYAATYTFIHGDAGTAVTSFTPASSAPSANTQEEATSAASTLTIPVVTGLSIDGAGHVTTATTATYAVIDSHANIDQVAATSNIISSGQANVELSVRDTDLVSKRDTIVLVTSSGSAIQYSSASVNLNGSSKAAISIDFVWGTF